jgi:hypothetical protein
MDGGRTVVEESNQESIPYCHPPIDSQLWAGALFPNSHHRGEFGGGVALAARLAGTAAETISVRLAVFARIDPALRSRFCWDIA